MSIVVAPSKGMLPHEVRAPFDNRPDPEKSIGLRVWCVGDGKQWFGRILRVNGRHVIIQLETKWSNKSQLTIDWESLRIADSQETPPPKKRGLDQVRVESLREAVTKRISRSPPPTAEEEVIRTELMNEHDEILFEMERIEELMDNLRTRARLFHDRGGLPRIELPPPRRPKRRMDQKARLRDIRDETRILLVSLLVEAGDTGVSSDEVVAVLCVGEITSHRVMGMLSALSRRGEATCQTGRWKRTDKL